MTKGQFIRKWGNCTTPNFEYDLEAVIATEIAKAQEAKPEEGKQQPTEQPELNPIAEAYDDGKIIKFEHPIKQAFYYKIKIRDKSWIKEKWVQLYSATQCINENGIFGNLDFIYLENFDNWEIYKEQDAEKITEHPKQKIKIGDRLINFNKGGSYGNVCKLLANCPFELYDENAKTYYTTYSLSGYELYTEPAEQPAPSMTYDEALNHILARKLTHKRAGNDSWYAYQYFANRIHFCDESGKDMIWVTFDELDLNEWYPHKKPFDKDRFEAMFRAVVASGEWNGDEVGGTEYMLKQLDSYYATKEGGANG